jgi:hypothetical protein
MDELSSWCETLQALLPTCSVRMMWDGSGAIVAAERTGRVVWLAERDLAGTRPSRVVERVRRQLLSNAPSSLAKVAV